jgi:hypothetical protein
MKWRRTFCSCRPGQNTKPKSCNSDARFSWHWFFTQQSLSNQLTGISLETHRFRNLAKPQQNNAEQYWKDWPDQTTPQSMTVNIFYSCTPLKLCDTLPSTQKRSFCPYFSSNEFSTPLPWHRINIVRTFRELLAEWAEHSAPKRDSKLLRFPADHSSCYDVNPHAVLKHDNAVGEKIASGGM